MLHCVWDKQSQIARKRKADKKMNNVTFSLNNAPQTIDVTPGESLLDTLRLRCNVTSLKSSCQPQGQCGCCLALIDGKPKVTCATTTERIEGKQILTLEGLPSNDRQLVADSFVAAAGLQCGFCIPGIVLRTWHLVENNPNPSRSEITKALSLHLCRCTGYQRIIEAIEIYAAAKRSETLPDLCVDGGVGAPLQRYEGGRLALGQRAFTDDLRFPDMLFGTVVQSPHARAKVLSIDISVAKAVEGVVAIATADDVPGQRWYGQIRQDWPGFVAVGEEVRCVGDILAVVAAVDRQVARKAAELVKVEYEILKPVLDPEHGLLPNAPVVNPTNGTNVLSQTVIGRGDVDAALKGSAHVVNATFSTPRIEHLFMETECAVVKPKPDNKLHVYTQGQGVFDDRRQIARFLDIPEEDIFIELVPSGGAFGGKEDLSIQAHAALLAKMTGKPVNIALTREQSIRMHPKRHPMKMNYTVGCDADGKLTAVRARIIGDSGAYASVGGKVLERAAGHACGPYRTPSVDIEALAVYTNNPPCGAMRGFGVNQTAFAIDGCLDLLAEKVGIDGWEMRWRNAVQIGDQFATGQVFEKSVGIRKTLQAVRDAYYQAKAAGKAVGIGCALKNSGLGNGATEWGKAKLVVETNGTISLYNPFSEMGQGLLTILIQIAVEVTGLEADIFRPKVDSTFSIGCGQTTGSRGTLLAGRAVKSAAENLKQSLDGGKTLADLAGEVFSGEVLIDDTTKPEETDKKVKTHTAFGFATQVAILDDDGRVERVVAAHDVGRVINPDLCKGQVEGGVHMGLGYALTEELPCVDGMPVTFRLRDLGVLRAQDMPVVEVMLVEEHEDEGPYGAKGVGEIGLVPTPGAVAGAIAAFDGIRHYTLPMKESSAARACSVGRIRSKSRDGWH